MFFVFGIQWKYQVKHLLWYSLEVSAQDNHDVFFAIET